MSNPWMKFYPADWRSDAALRSCSIGARGLWMEMLCIAHECSPRGALAINGNPITTQTLASLAGLRLPEVRKLIAELEAAGVFSMSADGTIYSRRMFRDEEKAARDKENWKDGGNPELRRGSVPKSERVRPFRRSDSPGKTARILAKSSGCCHWCDVELYHGPELRANTFHVDHLVPVCDGGTNDESNLVASCASCNHGRARIGWTAPNRRQQPNSISDTNPDTKAQKLEARSQSYPSQEEGLGRVEVVVAGNVIPMAREVQ